MTTSPARRRRACAGLVAVAPARRPAPRIPTTSAVVSALRVDPEVLARPHPRRLADRLNDTPRRCLGYRTPREVFEQHLAAPTGPP